jgi:hypothetical protein
MRFSTAISAAGFFLVALGVWVPPPAMAASAQAPAQRTFASADAAVAALIDDLRSDNRRGLTAILGPEAGRVLSSGDPVADRNAREHFVAEYDEAHHLEEAADGAVLVIGKEDWPAPIPLVKQSDRWRFDTKAGEQHVIDRRIGHNELDTIQTMLAYVDAQRDYADWTRQRTGTAEYARKILSSPGKQDGLYWPTAAGEPESPMGPLVAEAQREGYRRSTAARGRVPYHGYYYNILTAQGKNAPGGEADYVVGGRLIGGFALVAWPAQYGDSGVMTFIVNHDGIVYQRNLGPDTGALAARMTRYDPDPEWQKVEP